MKTTIKRKGVKKTGMITRPVNRDLGKTNNHSRAKISNQTVVRNKQISKIPTNLTKVNIKILATIDHKEILAKQLQMKDSRMLEEIECKQIL